MFLWAYGSSCHMRQMTCYTRQETLYDALDKWEAFIVLQVDAFNYTKCPSGRHDALAPLWIIYVFKVLQVHSMLSKAEPKGQKVEINCFAHIAVLPRIHKKKPKISTWGLFQEYKCHILIWYLICKLYVYCFSLSFDQSQSVSMLNSKQIKQNVVF